MSIGTAEARRSRLVTTQARGESAKDNPAMEIESGIAPAGAAAAGPILLIMILERLISERHLQSRPVSPSTLLQNA